MQSFVMHIGWIHCKFTFDISVEDMLNGIEELKSDKFAEFRKEVVDHSIKALLEKGQISSKDIKETYEALDAREWQFTISTIIPDKQWLDVKLPD